MKYCECSSCAASSSAHSVSANATVAFGSSVEHAMTSASRSQRSSQCASSVVARRNVTRAMPDFYVARRGSVNQNGSRAALPDSRGSEFEADLPRELAPDDVAENVLLDVLV